MLDISPLPPPRPHLPSHTYEPPGDGLPTCVYPSCGLARSHVVHKLNLVRTRVVLVVDHNPAFTPAMLEVLLAQAFATVPGVTLQQVQSVL